MPHHRGAPRGVVAIGASAGGIDALHHVVETLPEGLEVAVCVVLHIPAAAPSVLAQIIDRWTALDVVPATNGLRLRAGGVYVAPPDLHLMVGAGRLILDRGPKENGVRPAVDPLFRSAAAAYGPRAAAVVLSGALSDGAAGAAATHAAGGTVLVQDPRDALVTSMPEAALRAVPGGDAHVVRRDELGAAIAAFAASLPPVDEGNEDAHMTPRQLRPSARSHSRPDGPPSGFTCPECHGPLWQAEESGIVKYRCRVGHTYYEDDLIEEKSAEIESSLWSAVEALEEHAELMQKVAARMDGAGRDMAAGILRGRAADADDRAGRLRDILALPDGREPGAA